MDKPYILTSEQLLQIKATEYGQEIEDGYDPETAAEASTRVAVYRAIEAAQGAEDFNVHTYWNTDVDYFCDFWDMPSSDTWERLQATAQAVQQALGVTLHLCDCSHVFSN